MISKELNWIKRNSLVENYEQIKGIFTYFGFEECKDYCWDEVNDYIIYKSNKNGSDRRMLAIVDKDNCTIRMKIGYRENNKENWKFRDYLDRDKKPKEFSGEDPWFSAIKWWAQPERLSNG